MSSNLQPELSVVVAVYNEAPANVEQLLQRLHAVLEPLFTFYEVILVDDGSIEPTAAVLRDAPKRFPHVRTVVLSRNFGQHAAIAAGLGHARGQVTVNIDSDLQDPPELIPSMLECWREGFDVVYAQQIDRSDSPLKLLLTNAYYWLVQRFSNVAVNNAGEFRLMSRRAVDALMSLPEKTAFRRYLVPFIGFRQTQIPVKRSRRILPRVDGKRSYGIAHLLAFAIASVVSSSSLPLILFPALAVATTILAATIYSVFRFTNLLPPHWLHIFVVLSLSLFGLLSAVSLLLLAIYLSATLTEVRGRPIYIVAEVIEHANSDRCQARVVTESVSRPAIPR